MLRKTPLKRSAKPMKRTSFKRQRKAINRVGKTGKKNIEARSMQAVAFEQAGITSCELRLQRFQQPGKKCLGDWSCAFAHGKKRSAGRINDEERKYLVIWACQNCHDEIEGKPGMLAIVCLTIIARETWLDLSGQSDFFRRAYNLASELLQTEC